MEQEVARQDEFPRVGGVDSYVLGKYYESDGKEGAAREQYMNVVRESPFQTRLTRSAGQRIKALSWNPKDDRRKIKAVRREFRQGRRPLR